MKKLISLLLGVSMMLSLAACGGAPASTGTTSEAEPSTDTSESAAAETTGEDPYADLGNYTMIVGHAQPKATPVTPPWKSLRKMLPLPPTAM